MGKVKLSTLSKDETVYIEDFSMLSTVGEVLENFNEFGNKKLYTTIERSASFDAREMIERAIETEYCNGMYEDWDELITKDIEEKDIEEIQAVLDGILGRNPQQNIAYITDKLIEIDIK